MSGFRDISGLLTVMALAIGCSTGPVDLLDEIDPGEPVGCGGASACLEQGMEQVRSGRNRQAQPYLIEACRRGNVEGCRELGHLYTLGALGSPESEVAKKLYEWGCTQADDGQSCHAIGELHRLGRVPKATVEAARQHYLQACEMGERAGCHDAAVVRLEGVELDEERRKAVESEVVDVFDDLCQQGWAVGCVNHGYMLAAGRGTGRDHRRAKARFESGCHGAHSDWPAHRLGGLYEGQPRDLYAVSEYRPELACEQLEVLVVGGFEERIIAAFEAEKKELRRCYDGARRAGEHRLGRLRIEAGVTADGDGKSLRIVDDELQLRSVSECVRQMLSRHLDDGVDTDRKYTVRWGISFIHPPPMQEGHDGSAVGCDAQEVQTAIGEVISELRRCGRRHSERHGDDSGAVVLQWNFGPSGSVESVAMNTTVDHPGLGSCLRDIVAPLQISPGQRDACPVQLPLSFSDGARLHFSVIGRSQ